MSGHPKLELHIPTPRARPGDHASFEHLLIPPAGDAPRPEITARAATMRELAYDLIRVLDHSNRAVGPWDPRLEPDHLREGLKAMLLARLFDERMFRAHRQGKTSFYIKSTGEEAIGAAQS